MSEIDEHRYYHPQVQEVERVGVHWRKSAYAPVMLAAAGRHAIIHEVTLDDGRNAAPMPTVDSAIEPSNVYQLPEQPELPDLAA